MGCCPRVVCDARREQRDSHAYGSETPSPNGRAGRRVRGLLFGLIFLFPLLGVASGY
jgi:uncharacterized membrane protein